MFRFIALKHGIIRMLIGPPLYLAWCYLRFSFPPQMGGKMGGAVGGIFGVLAGGYSMVAYRNFW